MAEPKDNLEPLEPEQSESWFERHVELWIDRCLRILEFVTVAGLTLVVLAGAIYEAYWVLWGSVLSDRQTRMQSALTMLNGNWKIGLLLLIPLFFRTVRTFLERAEKFAGIEAPRAPAAVHPAKPNPIPQSNPSGGKG